MAKAPFVSENDKKAFWHATSHVLADAVKRLWPDVKLGIGPAIDEGFYYDFDKKTPFTPDDLTKIEAEMKKIIKENLKYERVFLTRKEAEKLLAKEPYKLDLLKEIKDKKISFARHGKFIDLCNSPLVQYTSQINSFKLLNTAAAYWRGDSKKPVLQRIYGISFPNKEMLDNFLKKREEAEKRDHRKLGPQLGLFFFHETAPGMPYWMPKGMIVLNELIKFWREEHAKRGYKEMSSPILNKKELWEASGHWEHYKDNMFLADMGKGEIYGLKAMNCPNAMLAFASKTRSYKDLPLRLSDTDVLHRYEASGAVLGLLRVRAFRQDDSHNYVTEEQIESEYDEIFKIIELFYGVFKIPYRFRLSLKKKGSKEFMGDEKTWEKAENILRKILDKKVGKGKYEVAEGEGAFYGPKIDILMTDALGREWQTGTVQLDFQQPKRFNLKYIDRDNKEKMPICIHRTIYGSLERFMGILIENCAGAFPVWLAPVQVRLLTFTDRNQKYAEKIEKELVAAGLRVETDYENNTVEYKVRQAELEKIPYILVVGDKEEKAGTIAVRPRGGKVRFGVKIGDFIKDVKKEIDAKT
ncbi:MAG: threonine--tRNA ligase [Candidatus Nanoarchaeia archaeon]